MTIRSGVARGIRGAGYAILRAAVSSTVAAKLDVPKKMPMRLVLGLGLMACAWFSGLGLSCQRKQSESPSHCSDTPLPTKVPGGIFVLKPPDTKVDMVGIENVEGALHDGYCFASFDALRAHDQQREQMASKVQAARAAVERARASMSSDSPDAGFPVVSKAHKHMLGLAVRGLPQKASDTDTAGGIVDRFLKDLSIGQNGADFMRFDFAHGDAIPIGHTALFAPELWKRVSSSSGPGWKLLTYRVASRDADGAPVEALWDFCLHEHKDGDKIGYYDHAIGAVSDDVCEDSLFWGRFVHKYVESDPRVKAALELLRTIPACRWAASIAPTKWESAESLLARALERDANCERAMNGYLSRSDLVERLGQRLGRGKTSYKAGILLGKGHFLPGTTRPGRIASDSPPGGGPPSPVVSEAAPPAPPVAVTATPTVPAAAD